MYADWNLPLPLFLFDKKKPDEPARTPEVVDDLETVRKAVIVCANCGSEITRPEARVTRRGSHEHAFFNPLGIVYDIGCFATAPGCVEVGVTSDEFSWFPGYIWQVNCCRNCQTHLGWTFSNGEDRFYGLVLERLREFEPEE